MTATNYTLQIGFKWDSTPVTNGKRALRYVFLNGAGDVYPPTTRNGKTYYSFTDGDTLKWMIFDLTGDTMWRVLNSVQVPFTLITNKPHEPRTPFRQKTFTHPDFSPRSGETTCDHLPGATASQVYPYWTPPDAPFVFETGLAGMQDYTFTVTVNMMEQDTFFVDPEMMVGSGG